VPRSTKMGNTASPRRDDASAHCALRYSNVRQPAISYFAEYPDRPKIGRFTSTTPLPRARPAWPGRGRSGNRGVIRTDVAPFLPSRAISKCVGCSKGEPAGRPPAKKPRGEIGGAYIELSQVPGRSRRDNGQRPSCATCARWRARSAASVASCAAYQRACNLVIGQASSDRLHRTGFK
jgi:hypothetical protein